MPKVEVDRITLPPLQGLSLSLESGLHVLFGTQMDGTASAISALSGTTVPKRGRVLIQGLDPKRSLAVRRHIGSLLAEEQLPAAKTVEKAVERVLRARNSAGSPRAVLSRLGLETWWARPLLSLTSLEQRSLALSLALSVEEPWLLTLYEPLAYLPGVDPRVVRSALMAVADSGACVVCATSSARDASALAARVVVLKNGRVTRHTEAALPHELLPGSSVEYHVQASDVRKLGGLLAAAPAILGVRWDATLHPGWLSVRGADAAAVTNTTIELSRAAGISVSALTPSVPSLELVHAASAGLEQAAFELSYRHAYAAALPQTGGGRS